MEQPTLEQPTLNQYSRARARATRPASNTVFQGSGVRKTKAPKNVTVEQRLKEFPGETFCKSAGILFCRGCTKTLSLIKQTLVVHTASEMHKQNKIAYLDTRNEDDDVKAIITEYFNTHPTEAQATLSPETLLFRWRVVEKMMEEGIGLNKVDALRSLLERGGEKLTTRSHLAQFVPQITAREMEIVQGEIKGEKGCIIFDGTTRLGEAVAALWRQCSPEFVIQTRLVAFRTTETHMSGDALFRLLSTILLRDLGKQPDEVIADARDSCATNGVAERLLMGLCPALARNKCASHVLVGTGQHIKLPKLTVFMVTLAPTLTLTPTLTPTLSITLTLTLTLTLVSSIRSTWSTSPASSSTVTAFSTPTPSLVLTPTPP